MSRFFLDLSLTMGTESRMAELDRAAAADGIDLMKDAAIVTVARLGGQVGQGDGRGTSDPSACKIGN